MPTYAAQPDVASDDSHGDGQLKFLQAWQDENKDFERTLSHLTAGSGIRSAGYARHETAQAYRMGVRAATVEIVRLVHDHHVAQVGLLEERLARVHTACARAGIPAEAAEQIAKELWRP